MKPEQKLQNSVCDYIRAQYPNVLFMVSASGFNTDNRKGAQLARMQNPTKGWPDLFIAQRGNGIGSGLFMELKPERYELYKKDGSLRKNEHTETQAEVHKMLHAKGYKATFAVGFDQAKQIIDEYLK
jgi:hypothetical protein